MRLPFTNDAPKTIIFTPRLNLWEIDAGEITEYQRNGKKLAQITGFHPLNEEVSRVLGELDEEICEGLSYIVPSRLLDTLKSLVAAFRNTSGFYFHLLRAYSVCLPGVLFSCSLPGIVVEAVSYAYYVYCDAVLVLNVTSQCCFIPLVYWDRLSDRVDIRTQEKIFDISLQVVSRAILEALGPRHRGRVECVLGAPYK